MKKINNQPSKIERLGFMHKLVARYARGNVSLQRGVYVTADQKEIRKAAILKTVYAY